MSLSFSSMLMCMVTSSIFSLILYWISLYFKKSYLNSKYLLLGMLFIGVRCLIPFKFFYTWTMISERILPEIQDIGRYSLPLIRIHVSWFLLYIWGLVAILKLLYLSYRQYRWERFVSRLPNSRQMPLLRKLVKEEKIRGDIRLIEVPDIIIPAIMGLGRPKIIIPGNIEDKDLHYVLLHELEHYRLYDLYFMAIIQFVCIIYWWNPIFYIFKKQVRKMIEFRVDSRVTEKLTKIKRLDYLQSLLHVLQNGKRKNFNAALELSVCEGYLGLPERFDNVLHDRKRKKGSLSMLTLLVALFVFFLSTLIVVEPYSINQVEKRESFEMPETAHLVEGSNHTYDLYVGPTYYFTISGLEGFLH